MTASVINLGGGMMAQAFLIDNVPHSEERQTRVMELVNNELFGLRLDNIERQRTNASGEIITFDYKTDYLQHGWLQSNPNTFILSIVFGNMSSFLYFNQITHIPQEVTINPRTFVVERTITLQNPFETFFSVQTNRTIDIIDQLQDIFKVDIADLSFTYAIYTSFRHTSTNATQTRQSIGVYSHYFTASSRETLKDIIIFDRSIGFRHEGNVYRTEAIWYGVGIGATLMFMGFIWIISKKK